MNLTNEILIVGGTGKTGRRVAERLTERGLPVRIASRSGATPFVWEDRTTWEPALRGVPAVYAAYAPDLAVPGAAETIGAFAARARANGAQRFVLLSGRGEEEAQKAEQAALAAFPATTVLRCSWFMQNFSEGFLLDDLLRGEVYLPTGDVAEPFVDADDIADAAVAALTDARHSGQIYDLTGPTMRTFAEAVAEMGRAAEREIAYHQIPPDQFTAAMERQGVPGEIVALLNYLFVTVLDGRNAHTADGVRRILGREPKDFSAFTRETAASGFLSSLPETAKTEVSR